MGRNKKYPFYVKRIEKNKTTDLNFYKIIGPYSYIHVSVPVDSDSSISKYTSKIKSKQQLEEFLNPKEYIIITEAEYLEKLHMVANYLGIDVLSKKNVSILIADGEIYNLPLPLQINNGKNEVIRLLLQSIKNFNKPDKNPVTF